MNPIKKLRSQGKSLEPSLRIGKNGLSEGMIREIEEQLTKKEMIKIKFLGSFAKNQNKRERAKTLADSVNAFVVESVGNTIVLQKRKIYK